MVTSGTVLEVINVNDTITNIVVRIKHNELFFPVCFVAFGDIKTIISQLRIEKNDIVKLTYYIKSKKHEDRYFTSAVIEKVSVVEKWSRQYSIGMTDEELNSLQ